jgi:cell division protein FtsA
MSSSNRAHHLICGLDIGSTKVAFVISDAHRDGIEILGLGVAAHTGARHGMIANIDAAVEAIRKAREEAELMSGQIAQKVWVAVGGTHIQSFDSNGMVAVRNKEVNEDDIARVIEAAKAIALPSDRKVIHVIPKEFKLDGQEGIADPRGMRGVRLEASVHIITAQDNVIQNIVKCVENAGIEIAGFVLSPLASATAVLSTDEKNLGVSVIDLGGGTSDIVTFIRGAVTHTACLPVGGGNFTHDVALGLRTTQINAEAIKKKMGSAVPSAVNGDENIEVESVGGRAPRMVSRESLSRILEARADETLKIIKQEIESKKFISLLGSGIVLTGGASDLKGLSELAEYVFDVPTRLGQPKRVGGLTDVVAAPSYATALGLLLYGYEQEKTIIMNKESNINIGEKMDDWGRKIKGLFVKSL